MYIPTFTCSQGWQEPEATVTGSASGIVVQGFGLSSVLFALMGILRKIQTLPAFVLGVFFLYWSLPLAALMNKVKFLKLMGKRNDAYGW